MNIEYVHIHIHFVRLDPYIMGTHYPIDTAKRSFPYFTLDLPVNSSIWLEGAKNQNKSTTFFSAC